MSALYENEAFIELTHGSLHPGGEALTRRALEAACLAPGARIMDVGCGMGKTVALLRSLGYDARGIDASEKLVTMAASPYVTLGDGRSIRGEYDALLLECVLSLMGDRRSFLGNACGALIPGGKLILCEPYRRSPAPDPNALPVESCVNGAPTRAELEALARGAGFSEALFQDETDALRSFIAMLIMAFGSADAFLRAMAGGASCAGGHGGCGAAHSDVKLGYAISVWVKERLY